MLFEASKVDMGKTCFVTLQQCCLVCDRTSIISYSSYVLGSSEILVFFCFFH